MGERINHPKHYNNLFANRSVECIDIAEHMSFVVGNAFKYIWRAGLKGGKKAEREDLEKAVWYLSRAVAAAALNREKVAEVSETALSVFNLIKRPEDPESQEFSKYFILRLIAQGMLMPALTNTRMLLKRCNNG